MCFHIFSWTFHRVFVTHAGPFVTLCCREMLLIFNISGIILQRIPFNVLLPVSILFELEKSLLYTKASGSLFENRVEFTEGLLFFCFYEYLVCTLNGNFICTKYFVLHIKINSHLSSRSTSLGMFKHYVRYSACYDLLPASTLKAYINACD